MLSGFSLAWSKVMLAPALSSSLICARLCFTTLRNKGVFESDAVDGSAPFVSKWCVNLGFSFLIEHISGVSHLFEGLLLGNATEAPFLIRNCAMLVLFFCHGFR